MNLKCEPEIFSRYGDGIIVECASLLKRIVIEVHNLIVFVQSLCNTKDEPMLKYILQ